MKSQPAPAWHLPVIAKLSLVTGLDVSMHRRKMYLLFRPLVYTECGDDQRGMHDLGLTADNTGCGHPANSGPAGSKSSSSTDPARLNNSSHGISSVSNIICSPGIQPDPDPSCDFRYQSIQFGKNSTKPELCNRKMAKLDLKHLETGSSSDLYASLPPEDGELMRTYEGKRGKKVVKKVS